MITTDSKSTGAAADSRPTAPAIAAQKDGQTEMDFAGRVEVSGERHPRHDELVRALGERGQATKRELAGLGFTGRELRRIVELDGGRTFFSYPGSPGYKLLRSVTLAEIRGVFALRSQARKQEARCVAILAAWHRLGREEPRE